MYIEVVGRKARGDRKRVPEAMPCTFCGGPPSRRRCGKVGRVRCCTGCAVATLPKLLLDAIRAGVRVGPEMAEQLQTGLEFFSKVYRDKAEKALAGGVGYRTEEPA
jgi:hypothetical protein